MDIASIIRHLTEERPTNRAFDAKAIKYSKNNMRSGLKSILWVVECLLCCNFNYYIGPTSQSPLALIYTWKGEFGYAKKLASKKDTMFMTLRRFFLLTSKRERTQFGTLIFLNCSNRYKDLTIIPISRKVIFKVVKTCDVSTLRSEPNLGILQWRFFHVALNGVHEVGIAWKQ